MDDDRTVETRNPFQLACCAGFGVPIDTCGREAFDRLVSWVTGLVDQSQSSSLMA